MNGVVTISTDHLLVGSMFLSAAQFYLGYRAGKAVFRRDARLRSEERALRQQSKRDPRTPRLPGR